MTFRSCSPFFVGNDNGFCEHGERCMLMPNYGAYQGDGDLVAAGIVGDVTVFARANNGR